MITAHLQRLHALQLTFRRTHRRLVRTGLLLLAGSMVGCGSNSDTLDRVAIEVAVQIDGALVTDGTLALRPDPGVKCPLIRVPVIDGIGRLDDSVGPVPGSYQASFRPSGGGADITEQLTKAGRVDPTSGNRNTSSPPPSDSKNVAPRSPVPLTVPASNPAKVTVNFAG